MTLPLPHLPHAPGVPLADGRACSLTVLDGTGRLGAEALEFLRRAGAAALGSLGAGGEVRVRVVDDAEMGAAHREYLDEPGTTDVITFDLSDPPAFEGGALDVDILVCLDEGLRQGAAHGHAPERELLLYIVHGVLHCLGFDDHDPEGAAAMHAKEDEVLRAIGVGATYRPSDGGGPT